MTDLLLVFYSLNMTYGQEPNIIQYGLRHRVRDPLYAPPLLAITLAGPCFFWWFSTVSTPSERERQAMVVERLKTQTHQPQRKLNALCE